MKRLTLEREQYFKDYSNEVYCLDYVCFTGNEVKELLYEIDALRADLAEVQNPEALLGMENEPPIFIETINPADETYPKDVQQQDGLESRDFYITHKDNPKEIVGLHSVGAYDEIGNWHNMESWLNIYDQNRNFRYSASRFSNSIEEQLESWKRDGWEVIE